MPVQQGDHYEGVYGSLSSQIPGGSKGGGKKGGQSKKDRMNESIGMSERNMSGDSASGRSSAYKRMDKNIGSYM